MSTAIRLSNATFLIALVSYFVAMVASFGYLAYKAEPWRKGAMAALGVGVTSQAVSLAAIVVHLHRAPWGSIYEFCSSMALLMMAVTLFAIVPRRGLAAVSGFLCGVAVVLMGAGWVWYAPPSTLVPALRSNWLTFHVFMAITGSTMLLAAAVVSALYLVRLRWEGRNPSWDLTAATTKEVDAVADAESGTRTPELAGRPTGPGAALAATPRAGRVARQPAAERLDELARRLVIIAFPIWTVAIFAGAIWGEQAWGRYWGWDPKETMSFMIWATFAVYLHARATKGWRTRGAAWVGVTGGVLILANMFVVNILVSGLHSYAMP
ncbi:MAG: c-type cytochrome biogenesis protein CcsB [Acidimicrobiia bacterium]|nr:c-type cytochrome biogenesis protein CcsB [Acidimicrobiia bacterium]